jgi:ADP-ribose pyrophosphatase
MTIERLASKEVYRNPWMTVREDSIRRPDGSTGIYGVVHKPDFVLVIPYEHGTFHLVEQYRHPVQGRYLEFPQGSWETAENAAPETVAAGELREETGLVAGRMTYLGHVFNAPGYSNQGMHVFLAEELSPGPQQLTPEEGDLVCTRVTVEEFEALVRQGRIKDGSTLAAYGLLRIQQRAPKGVIQLGARRVDAAVAASAGDEHRARRQDGGLEVGPRGEQAAGGRPRVGARLEDLRGGDSAVEVAANHEHPAVAQRDGDRVRAGLGHVPHLPPGPDGGLIHLRAGEGAGLVAPARHEHVEGTERGGVAAPGRVERAGGVPHVGARVEQLRGDRLTATDEHLPGAQQGDGAAGAVGPALHVPENGS